MMTLSKTPIEKQLQRNTSIIFKQKNIREYLPRESTNMARKFELFRNKSLVQRNTAQISDPFSSNNVRRHNSELSLGRPYENKMKLSNYSSQPVRNFIQGMSRGL